jgi:6-pyruvoyltetrahydropterin/6-carboxytetrahydropterin synthase
MTDSRAKHELSRCVRFCVHPNGMGEESSSPDAGRRDNTFAGWPSMIGLGAFYELHVTCRGTPDSVTGYMMSISVIDDAVRRVAIPAIDSAFRQRPRTEPGVILAELLDPLNAALGGAVQSIRWQLTPYYAVAMTTASPDRVLIRQQFEFAASHRLHCPSLTEEQNRDIFGRCNNASGHGHNYRIEPLVSVPLVFNRSRTTSSSAGDTPLNLRQLERIVNEHVIQRFDHKHLNLDTEEFAELNPSVEHIAKVCYDRLAQPIEHAGGRLIRVTVWETEKTSCSYPALEREW